MAKERQRQNGGRATEEITIAGNPKVTMLKEKDMPIVPIIIRLKM